MYLEIIDERVCSNSLAISEAEAASVISEIVGELGGVSRNLILLEVSLTGDLNVSETSETRVDGDSSVSSNVDLSERSEFSSAVLPLSGLANRRFEIKEALSEAVVFDEEESFVLSDPFVSLDGSVISDLEAELSVLIDTDSSFTAF